jgi:hypothetical protein
MNWRFPASRLAVFPNRFGLWFLLSALPLRESDKDYLIGPKHLYYQTNRDKVSEWSCGI